MSGRSRASSQPPIPQIRNLAGRPHQSGRRGHARRGIIALGWDKARIKNLRTRFYQNRARYPENYRVSDGRNVKKVGRLLNDPALNRRAITNAFQTTAPNAKQILRKAQIKIKKDNPDWKYPADTTPENAPHPTSHLKTSTGIAPSNHPPAIIKPKKTVEQTSRSDQNLLPKKPKETITSYAKRLAADMVNPDSLLWKSYRAHVGLTKEDWEEGFPPNNVFPYPVTRWDINCGHCETIADLLEVNFPGGQAFWIEELYDSDPRFQPENFASWTKSDQKSWYRNHADDAPTHQVYALKGKFYDSDSPKGVEDWTLLPAWQNRNKTRAEWLAAQPENQITGRAA